MSSNDDTLHTQRIETFVPVPLLQRVDGMVDTLGRYSPLPKYGPVNRDLVIRLALTTGIEAMEAEYGEPTVQTERDALLAADEEVS